MNHLSFLAKITFALFLMTPFFMRAQEAKTIHFKSGNYTPINNMDKIVKGGNFTTKELVNSNYYRIIQFNEIPTQFQKDALAKSGIVLLNYIPQNAFFASISNSAQLESLKKNGVISVHTILPKHKLTKELLTKKYPKWAMYGKNMIEINAIYHQNITKLAVLNKLQGLGLEVTMSNNAQTVRFRVKLSELDKIYQLSEFYYFETIDMPEVPEGIVDRTNHRSNVIATDYLGGLKFDGTGMTVMLQDNADLVDHIDYTGRFFNNATALGLTGNHGEHTGGIIGAAGNLDPKGRGMAYGADILVYGSSDNNYNAVPNLYNNNDLTITSKSFGNGNNAGYTTLARQLDQQTRTLPSLIHVFSAGNSGTSDFGYGAGAGWGNITGGHKQGKNVIAVGNLTFTDAIASSSSRGPAADGRIKPDICAVGSSVFSTLDPNTYQNLSGTSMACPGVAGTMAQLYHAYKSLNGNVNPNATLMKGLVLNTADDLGNTGPDYIYGWGRINARRAYNVLNNTTYLSATVSQGGNNTHTINVPAGVTQLRVMVYWSDFEGTANSAPALVNNINIQVVDPGSASFNPWVLDPTPNATALNSVAVRGIDNLNNVEQVTIDNPTVGAYTVNVDGFSIPQGPQEYFLIYEFVQDEVVLTYPIGREGFPPAITQTIRWDSYGGTGTFNLEYSDDNGSTWNTINGAVAANRRYHNWSVPNIISGEVLVKVTRGAVSDVSDAVFSIIRTPINLNIDWACPDSMQMSWNPTTGATAYEVSMLGNKYMDSIGVTNTNSFVIHGINPLTNYWLSVRALGSTGARGERAIAIEKTPGTFSCSIPIDVSASNSTPVDNDQLLSCMVGNTINVRIDIKNEGVNTLSNIPVHYQLNNGAVVNEIYAGPLSSGATFNYTFTASISPTGLNNTLLVWVDMLGDGNTFNDTTTSQFDVISTPVQGLPWSEDFESFGLCGTASDCEVEVCGLTNGFINESNGAVDDIDWRTDQGGTPSNGTGPTVDFNPGNSSGNYLYLEASGGCTIQDAELITPCIDLASVSSAQLTFAYNMNGADMGTLFVDVFSNGVWTNNVTLLNGNKGPSWLVETVSLTPFVGTTVNIRFRGRTGNDFASDLAIDDINVSGTVGIDEVENNLNFSIYPNPSKGIFNYNYLSQSELAIKLYDVNGKVIFSENIAKNASIKNGIIDITAYTNGIYMLVITGDLGRITKKIIKE